MIDTFGEIASRWCSVAAQLLGWSPDDFWSATPDELVLSLKDPSGNAEAAGPDRATITKMMERDAHG